MKCYIFMKFQLYMYKIHIKYKFNQPLKHIKLKYINILCNLG